ncbi:sister chromatid cohesion protein Ctf8, putative [Talaromyces stipitatus ATCC 10500]|uniref:Sister chromatid cohesion protein Ctf8, putative n=1 Tax=Talaromyces stipitatus (strain ATCC 10500 / CBS 375.48 / QM 6759 / NRRL 1006) TaxID=441959 RepID=B8LWQ3_TALSN|nr:sister chromatid cohesion protein Ctf8, putative [Talaromyces stipitatus ATCC 10500]EED24450.1 sister chromatid cohesion protein Ctf8, putative [Talaromyces stipitatus ATCC 10500]
MPSVPLHPPNKSSTVLDTTNDNNPLPPLLRTPSGLAILELQGTINFPTTTPNDDVDMDTQTEEENTKTKIIETELGKIMFPDYSDLDPESTKWMKRVYLYAGRYQRMTGEVKKLAKPLAVIQRRPITKMQDENGTGGGNGGQDELEIVDVIKYKIIFASRPEPVGLETIAERS